MGAVGLAPAVPDGFAPPDVPAGLDGLVPDAAPEPPVPPGWRVAVAPPSRPAGARFEHATTLPTIAAAAIRAAHRIDTPAMWILLLEAFGAMAIGVFIVWWTMFAGRTRGERRDGSTERRADAGVDDDS